MLARYSGSVDDEQTVISSASHVYVYFFSNYANAGKGFTIDYTAGRCASID